MPLIYQHRIYRSDLQRNPNVLYVFGDNVDRYGLAGQAKEMRGEPNAVGVATKWHPTKQSNAYFSNERFQEQSKIIRADLEPVLQALFRKKVVIWPADGIGTGLSDLPSRSPLTWRILERLRLKMGEI